MPALSFGGKTALVFGGTAGIGRSAAIAFAAAGANVFISGLGVDEGREVAAAARAKGVEAVFMEAILWLRCRVLHYGAHARC